MSRPVLYVLAGINGAGKSSIGGHLLNEAGLAWFNPDTFARELVRHFGYDQSDANIAAWTEGVRRLDEAIALGRTYAFETTLGGRTIVKKLIAAAATHDVLVWFCGLRDAEQHIARVRQRVAQGGHDIPEERIRQRCRTSLQNLLGLMPHLSLLSVYDNSVDAAIGTAVPDPRLVLRMEAGRRVFPATIAQARQTPDWAKPLVEAAFQDDA
jgi:predicted ABC-type ATPase